MNFSSFFRLEENLNLDRKTLYILRWIALVGQFIAINLVYFILDLPFPVELSYLIIFVGLITNLFLQFSIKGNQLKDFQALIFLIYDLLQLSLLLSHWRYIQSFFNFNDYSHNRLINFS